MFSVNMVLFELNWEISGNIQHYGVIIVEYLNSIILSEQNKIELANAQKMGYLFENIMSEFSGQKNAKIIETFRTSE